MPGFFKNIREHVTVHKIYLSAWSVIIPDSDLILLQFTDGSDFFYLWVPASYPHNLVSGTHKIYACESQNSQNTIENCSKICKGLLILSWDSSNIYHVSP